ncbi:hypothetical protein [Klebsiella phage vB_KpnM_TU02]|nr:hypothetical protein [Klebsiella phage vB_KpnM_TU02]
MYMITTLLQRQLPSVLKTKNLNVQNVNARSSIHEY